MGRTYLFECSRCGYYARVAGGASEGIHFAVQTISCSDCRELHDAVVRFKLSPRQQNHPPVHPPRFALALNRLWPRGTPVWIKFKPACPTSSRHRIRLWKQPDKCPRCGNFMEPGALPFRIWD